MNVEIAKMWVEALRSGKYKQARKALCRIDEFGEKSYCCLGVLCDIAVDQLAGIEVRKNSSGSMHMYDNEAAYPPLSVVQWAELKDISGLADLNDRQGRSFEEIAGYIERHHEEM
jgi:hypothetical protein